MSDRGELVRIGRARGSARLAWLAALPWLGLACSLPPANTPTDAGTDQASVRTCRPNPPCPDGWFSYTDTVCSPPFLNSGPGCSANGDGLCYKDCASDTDCRPEGFPICRSLTFYNGSDVGQPRPACVASPPPPLCSGPDAATD
jgi:hypothetical protein